MGGKLSKEQLQQKRELFLNKLEIDIDKINEDKITTKVCKKFSSGLEHNPEYNTISAKFLMHTLVPLNLKQLSYIHTNKDVKRKLATKLNNICTKISEELKYVYNVTYKWYPFNQVLACKCNHTVSCVSYSIKFHGYVDL